MVNYFDKAKTTDELKAIYKGLVKKYHPDIYGEKGNEILKEIHNQLEKAVKNLDVNFKAYSNYVDIDINETPETRAKKAELLQEALKYTFPEGALFALYWEHNLKVNNHRNPLTSHNFSGWNIWTLEIEYLKNNYTSCKWSTFPQYREAKNFVKKGEHGCYITLAIIAKPKKDENNLDDEPQKPKIYYKGYTVFNENQTRGEDLTTPALETQKAIPDFKNTKSVEQKTLNLWSAKYKEVIA